MKATTFFVAVIALATSLYAQTTSTTSGTTSITSGSTTTGLGWVTGNADGTLSIPSVGSGSTIVMTDGGGRTWSWPADTTLETRKDDGKGPTIIQVDRSAKIIKVAQLAPVGYMDLAVKIGLTPSPVMDEANLLDAISTVGLHVYDWTTVDEYLYRKALRQGAHMRWVWKPLREADLQSAHMANAASGFTIPRVGYIFAEQYAQEVPLRILMDVKAILDADPSAKFFISDYETIKPDPFLMVTTEKLLKAGKCWIIDRWDEPGFSEASQVTRTVAERQ